MKYGRFVFALAALTLAGCAAQKQTGFLPPSLDVKGTYRADGPVFNEKIYLSITDDGVTKMKICTNGKFKAEVSVTAPARVTEGTIEIMQNVEKIEKAGDMLCIVKLEKGVVAYRFNRYQELYLTPEDGGEAYFGYKLGSERPSLFRRVQDGSATAVEMVIGTKQFNEAAVYVNYADRAFTNAAKWTNGKLKAAKHGAGRALRAGLDAQVAYNQAKVEANVGIAKSVGEGLATAGQKVGAFMEKLGEKLKHQPKGDLN